MLQLIGDHLWQSTVCGGVAWLLTLVLRKNHAGIRFWVWFAASMKFLVPLAALVALGAAMPWKPAPVAARSPIEMFELVSQPFSSSATTAVPVTPQTARWTLENLAATGAPVIWMLGMLLLLGVWFARWRRIRAAVAASVPDVSSREWLRLAQLAAERGLSAPALRLSSGAVEPAVIGVRRPVLLWPTGISARLTDAQVEAILAHELAHIARRDNLLALLHMGVQALFWFHPLVWFIGTRLVHERERACDEDVVRRSGQREAYAEGILRTCEHCVESSLSCAAGVTGADLKARIAAIMRGALRSPLRVPQLALLIVASVVVLVTPLILGAVTRTSHSAMQQAASGSAAAPLTSDLRFEVASVKANASGATGTQFGLPGGGRFTATNATARELVRMAYSTQDYKLVGLPNWTSSERFDIEALAGKDITLTGDPGKPSPVFLMLRSLLVERFGLTLHTETREMPVYVLSHARADRVLGPTLTPSTTDCVAVIAAAKAAKATPPSPSSPASDRVLCGSRFSPGRHSGGALDMDSLSGFLSNAVGRAVLNRTGLTGRFDWVLEFRPDSIDPSAGASPSGDVNVPPLLAALQEQLGLKLEAAREPVEVLVVDAIKRPSDDNADSRPAPAAPLPVSATVSPNVAAQPAAPSATPQASTLPPAFEAATLKRNFSGPGPFRIMPGGGRLRGTNLPAKFLVAAAFAQPGEGPLQPYRIIGAPDWMSTARFDLEAKAPESVAAAYSGPPFVLFAMLRTLLVDTFKMAVRQEKRDIPVYSLVRGRRDGQLGPQLTRRSDADCQSLTASLNSGSTPKEAPDGRPTVGFTAGADRITGGCARLQFLIDALSRYPFVDRLVVNRTDLDGLFDFTLTWTPDTPAPSVTASSADGLTPPGAAGASLFSAIEEQLGLKLQATTAPVDVIVIDRALLPTD